MARYFLELAYKGTHYAGFQIQQNANSIQEETQKALQIFFKKEIELTGSSRTDAGVHARQNFFHFDSDTMPDKKKLDDSIYNLNAILPSDIVIKKIFQVESKAHCRFDALCREYNYYIYRHKNPFLEDWAFYFPYQLDVVKLKQVAEIILAYEDFTSFSKRNTQVKTFMCRIMESEWIEQTDCLIYHVKANRFLRGMVRGLVGTMLKIGTGKISLEEFVEIIESKDSTKTDFSVPPQGLFLEAVHFPNNK
jgi:tRNA pseudouridine38-40 synthase